MCLPARYNSGMAHEQSPVSESGGKAEPFATTNWSLVLAAGQRGSAESAAALERLCAIYWPPLYAYVRRRVADVHEAQDLTQAFFERVLEKDYLADADPERGRFRAFLLTAFQHFLSKEWDKAKAQKRGGGRRLLPFDVVSQPASEPASELTAEQVFEREWAITLLLRVMQRLQREMERDGKGRQFNALKAIFTGDSRGTKYSDAARELGLSDAATRMGASRMRQRYRVLLRDEIAATVSSPDDVEDEIRRLFAAFQ